FCNENLEIKEKFLGFYSTEKTSGESLLGVVKKYLADSCLDFANIVGQCYDGASNIKGEYKGLAARVRLEAPTALYIHCYAHRLNLALLDSCDNIKEVHNTLGQGIDRIDKSCMANSIYLSIFSTSFLFYLDVLTELFGIINILSKQLHFIVVDKFERILIKITNLAIKLEIDLPEDPRIRKKPNRFLNGTEVYLQLSANEQFNKTYIEIIETLCSAIEERFDNSNIEPIIAFYSIITTLGDLNEDFVIKSLGSFINHVNEKKTLFRIEDLARI
ncbi:unnamed protein product, partial [Brachionus calyciflorus]